MLLTSVYRVLVRPWYAFLAISVASTVAIAGVLIPQYQLIKQILVSRTMVVPEKLVFVASILGSIETNFTVVSASILLITAVLFGINIAMLLYYIKRARAGIRSFGVTSASTFGGLISGVFGIGCAACGSLIATSVLITFGAGGLITLLPLRGVEFGFVGVLLILYSIWLLAKKINTPLVCDIA